MVRAGTTVPLEVFRVEQLGWGQACKNPDCIWGVVHLTLCLEEI